MTGMIEAAAFAGLLCTALAATAAVFNLVEGA
jgi:hypothetical protein